MKETQIQIDGVLIDVLKNHIAKFICETTPQDIVALHQAYTLLRSQSGAIEILKERYGEDQNQGQEKLARFMHEEYEKIAIEKGWKTQESTKVPFDNLPSENKETMLALAKRIDEHYHVFNSLTIQKINEIAEQIGQFAYDAAPYADLVEKASKFGAEWKDFEKARKKAESLKVNVHYIGVLKEAFYTLLNNCNANRFTIGNDIFARYQKYGKTFGADKKPYYQERVEERKE